jgi:Protein of unknown function (DUF4238)/SEC-C motif
VTAWDVQDGPLCGGSGSNAGAASTHAATSAAEIRTRRIGASDRNHSLGAVSLHFLRSGATPAADSDEMSGRGAAIGGKFIPMTTRRNHYVPVWYQKAFGDTDPARLYCLDLAPDDSPAPAGGSSGSRRAERGSPKKFFWSQDLYTTLFFGTPNDEIERFLFGAIDNYGAIAVRAVASGDPRAVHESFQNFFSYIDAQKIRTPKGLDWIRARYGELNQHDLMHEMQALRQMHCTMWLEAVREVASAEDSDVKFIVTDHPVTIYNANCPPDAEQCRYPDDPPIELIGSQTLFVLNANHCLILTNLEYAKDPSGADLLRPRQNPRHFGTTLARTDAWIRTRKLSRSEVIAINHILKSRARRYIAAAEEEWLYPERAGVPDWSDTGKILLPPERELWHFGGEIIVGYNDGTSSFQDAFGRISPSNEYLRKEPPAADVAPDEACPCGSGKGYQACCKDLPPEDRVPWDVFSIRERNLMFFRAIENILGLNAGKTWEDVRRELSDEQVKKIHSTYAALWPKDTNIADLLPRPDGRVVRALYIGIIDPRTIAASVIGWLRYFDEILVLNPFTNATLVRPEYSPIDSPGQYKEQTIKNVALLMALVSFIYDGVVHLVPDPMDFSETFRQGVWTIAKERRSQLKPDSIDLELGRALGEDDFKRMWARLPEEDLRRQIGGSDPDAAEDKITELIAYIRKQHEADPLALIQPLATGKDGGQLMVMRGVNFELALFLTQLTGAAVYSDQRLTRDDLAAAHLAAMDGGADADRTLALELALALHPEKIRAAREAPTSLAVRASLRTLFATALAQGDTPDVTAVGAALARVEATTYADLPEAKGPAEPTGNYEDTVFEIDADLIVPTSGYGLIAVRRFLVAFGRRRHMDRVPLAILFGRATSGAEARRPERRAV